MAAVSAENPNAKVIDVLVRAGADTAVRDGYGQTVLMVAAKRGLAKEIIMSLLKAGADANVQDNSGLSALMLAARNHVCSDVIASLLRAGAEIGARDSEGHDAVWHAQHPLVGAVDEEAVRVLWKYRK